MLLLHIGSEKTGSSSIQWMLRSPVLSASGVRRLQSGADFGQPAFVNSLSPASRHHGAALAALSAMADRVNAEPEKTHVLSVEMLFRKGVAGTLARAFGEGLTVPIKVICYLRRPDSYLEALYKQKVKNGRIAAGPQAFREATRDGLDYHGILDEYAAAFGASSIIVRPYERGRFPDGNVVLDFLAQIGVGKVPDGLDVALNRNRSLSAAASELLGLVARNRRSLHKSALDRFNASSNPDLRRSGDVYSRADRQAIMAECASNLERVRETYRPDLPALFDVTDLADGQADAYPSEGERLKLTRAAAEEAIAVLCDLCGEGEGDAGAEAQPGGTRPGRAERRARRAARRDAAGGDSKPARRRGNRRAPVET